MTRTPIHFPPSLGAWWLLRALAWAVLVLAVVAAFVAPARAAVRIKDIVDIEGVRDNMLVGYGIVVGLNGTGDSLQNSPFTEQSLVGMLERLGVNIRDENLRTANVAAVMVTATLPPFARQGSRIDIKISSLGDASNLRGGTLLVTPLMGADGEVYAVGQGAIQVSGFAAVGAAETIARYTGKLVAALCVELEGRGIGARRLDLLFHRVDNTRQAIRIGTAQPVRDAKRLTRLLCEKIETIDPGFGIEIMELAAVLAEPLRDRQAISSLVEEPEADISDLIDVLANRVGENRLCRFTPVQSDVPERSVISVPPLAPETGATWDGDWQRPPRLLARPEPIETMAVLPDNPPVWFTWRGVRRRVRRADGPERIRGEWWKCDAEMSTVRDYFRVEDEAGERYWLFRSGDGEHGESGSQKWFLHGIFG